MTSPYQHLEYQDVTDLDEAFCEPQGQLRVNPSEAYAKVPWAKLRLWAHLRGLYGLPTPELVAFISKLIGDRSAVEIGAGNGCLGRALGIPRTDSFIQNRPDVRLYYLTQGQPTVEYGSDVECLGAEAAVEAYRPQVVVGSWITQWSDGSRSGSFFGVDEEKLLSRVETYILFGSLANHGHPDVKAISARPHRVIQEPWMWSRAKDSALFVWGES